MSNDTPTTETVLRLNNVDDVAELLRKERIVLPTPAGGTISLPTDAPHRDRSTLIAEYWAFHPRFRFLKTTRRGATLADFGAGSGGLAFWRQWGAPARHDLKMYAVDLKKGQHFDAYNGFDVADLNRGSTAFADGMFDYAVLSHVIEHIENHDALFDDLRRVCRANAALYIEWPHPRSAQLVPRDTLGRLGIAASTINFFDDPTHLRVVTEDQILASLEVRGFQATERGTITNEYLAEEMFSYAHRANDMEVMTYALWLSLGFSQYIVAHS